MLQVLLVLGLGALAVTKWAGKRVEGLGRAEKSDEPHEDLEGVGGFASPIWGNYGGGDQESIFDFSLGRSAVPYTEDQVDSLAHTKGMSRSWNRAVSSIFSFRPFNKPIKHGQDLKAQAFAREEQIKKEEAKRDKRKNMFSLNWLEQLFSGRGSPTFSTPIKKDDEIIINSRPTGSRLEGPHDVMVTKDIPSPGYFTRGMKKKNFMTEQAMEIEDSFLSEPDTMGPFAPSYQHFVAGQPTVVDRGKKDEETIESH